MIDIRPLQPSEASESDFEQLNNLRNSWIREATPDDPPSTVQSLQMQILNIPPVFDVKFWVGWDDNRAIATGNLGFLRTDTNQHLAQGDIFVDPAYRRQGLADRFLALFVEMAEAESRSLLIGTTHSTVPSGPAFMKKLGGNVGLSMRRNDLLMAEVDRQLIEEWIARAPERASGFEIVVFEGPYPSAELGPISEMQKAINNMPTDSLDIEDIEFSPEHLRQFDESMVAQGRDRWSLVAREKASGNYVGWTDVSFDPSRPTVVDVGGTAVSKEYQNLGLGRWLKAAIIQKLILERPDVERIRTGNAHSNAPMLKINDELGFKPALTIDNWQIELEKVKDYLSRREAVV